MKKILFIVCIALMSCSSSRTVLTERTLPDFRTLLDSISASGTVVGPLRTWSFITDDNRQDQVMIGTLYKKEVSTGSIQIRKVDALYNVKVIDVVKKRK